MVIFVLESYGMYRKDLEQIHGCLICVLEGCSLLIWLTTNVCHGLKMDRLGTFCIFVSTDLSIYGHIPCFPLQKIALLGNVGGIKSVPRFPYRRRGNDACRILQVRTLFESSATFTFVINYGFKAECMISSAPVGKMGN